MKFFSAIPTLAAVAFGAMSVVAQDSAAAIINELGQLTQLSATARSDAASITVNTAAIQFPVVLADVVGIISRVDTLTVQVQGDADFADQQAAEIVTALGSSVQGIEQFLNALAQQEANAARVAFVVPVVAAVTALQGSVAALEPALIATIPTQAGSAEVQFSVLDNAFASTIAAYTA
ncbi:hypothetical protein BN946_scf184940.g14 [Trametes cinnabarina]|uniref:Uncharacterized protein n=1 Tax=Pycnoporus cinnabarinus TaxID=5643 RepID=A0A060SBL2_PYCCI|nr:hypothetical protein BN946_scf184940.g14 [Trametes cinnabarina]